MKKPKLPTFSHRPSPALTMFWQRVRYRLQNRLPETVLLAWIDHCTLERINEERVVLRYTGEEDPIPWQTEYGELLRTCLEEILGHPVRVVWRKRARRLSWRPTPRRLLAAVAALAVLAAALLGLFVLPNGKFREVFYQISCGKVTEPVRILQISDLHSSVFGRDNEDLLHRVELLAPDLIVLTGDAVDQDDHSYEVTLSLCGDLVEIAPVCYIYGNNETSRQFDCSMSLEDIDELLDTDEENRDSALFRTLEDPLRDDLEAVGVQVLLNESTTVELEGAILDVYGVLTSNPSAFWPYAGTGFDAFQTENPGHLKLLLCHEPYLFSQFPADSPWADLTLCGHTHGGGVRVPYLGALYEREYGLLPDLSATSLIHGLYTISNAPLVVSSGLSKRSGPRFNNPPELVILDINAY